MRWNVASSTSANPFGWRIGSGPFPTSATPFARSAVSFAVGVKWPGAHASHFGITFTVFGTTSLGGTRASRAFAPFIALSLHP